jgi:uncharacterized protein
MWHLVIFSNIATDEEEKAISIETRERVRAEHLERCRTLMDQQRLLAGGPFPRIDSDDPKVWKETGGYAGGMVIVDFSTLAEAEEWAQADPYFVSGVFGGVPQVHRWYQTVGKGVSFGRAW